MSYVNLKEMLQTAVKNGYAVGAFNIVNYNTAEAVIQAAQEANTPVILQTSTSTVKQIGAEALISFLKLMAQKADIPVAVHLDHCTDKKTVIQCIDAGWSSVMYDGSKEVFDRNMEITREVVQYASARDVSVEGELGAIVGVEDEMAVDADASFLADPEKSRIYAEYTGIDAFAPAIGTAHGVYKGEPKIDFERFRTIAGLVACPLVVHGGTGLSAEVFHRLISLGAAKINVSTAIKIAYIDAMFHYVSAHREEYNPLRVDRAIVDGVKGDVLRHIGIFGSKGVGQLVQA